MGVTRRDLFRMGRKAPEMRPPWALAEPTFVTRCSRCNDCVAACPQKILFTGDGGFPVISFTRGACDFCGDCASACKPGALARRDDARALPLVAAAQAGCLSLHGTSCRVCGEWCEPGAIRFRLMVGGRAEVQVDQARCSGCGACVARCPVGAVAMLRRPQEEMAECA